MSFQEEGYDPTDSRHVTIASEIERNRREQQITDLKKILATIEGRRFFWRYLSLAGVFHSSFTGNNTTFFNEGKREIGLKLLADLNEAVPQAFVLMQTEEAQRLAFEKNKLLKELKDVRT